MTTQRNELRARFEQWARELNPEYPTDLLFAKTQQGNYININREWLAYCAGTQEAERGMVEAVGILKKLVDYPNETSVSDDERALWADARALLARLKKGEAA